MRKKKHGGVQGRDPVANADSQSALPDAPNAKDATARVSAPCRVHFHHIRKRLADYDNLSGKAVLDGIVQAGILTDDSAEYVTEKRDTQSKGPVEKTIVTLSVDGSCSSIRYASFEDWYQEIEGYSLRAERLKAPVEELRSAFEAGRQLGL